MGNKPNESRAGSLPPNATEFIRQVVRKMGWRRKARQEVEAELTAHFEDELRDCADAQEEEGRAQQLVEGFGDVKLLAVLCRRAKNRCRPLWVRALACVLQATGLFLLLFTPYTIWFVRGKPNPTIDYLPQLNALNRPFDPVEDNAWPYYESAMRFVVEPNETVGQARWFESLGPTKDVLTLREQKVLLDWIAANLPAWRQFEIGATKRHCHRTYRGPPGKPLLMSCTDDPPLMNLRRLNQVGHWKSRLAVEGGQTEEALDFCLTLIRAGAHLQQNVTIVEELMAYGMGSLARRELLGILHSNELSALRLCELQTQLTDLYRERYPPLSLEGERLVVLDGIQCEFTSGGPGGGHHVVGAYTRFVYAALEVPDVPENRSFGWIVWPIDIAASMIHAGHTRTIAKVNQLYDRMGELVMRSPYDRRQHGIGEIMDGVGRLGKLRYGIVYLLLPAERRASEIRFRAKADHEALITVLAIKRSRLEKGAYPATLNELKVAHYLDALPADPYSNGPLIYKIIGNDFTLYSVGPDFHDDGGVPGRNSDGKHKMWADNGDTVFWPVP